MVGQRPDQRLLLELLKQDMDAPDFLVAALDFVVACPQLSLQELDFVAQGLDQGGRVLSTCLSRAVQPVVHRVQHDAPAAVGGLEASNSPTLQAFAQGRDAQPEARGRGGQVDAVLLLVHPCPAPVLPFDDAGSLSQAPARSGIFYQWRGIVAGRARGPGQREQSMSLDDRIFAAIERNHEMETKKEFLQKLEHFPIMLHNRSF
jgi:hypothetical protein